jgi:Type II CAAX prenyl endopeptidase Rce1-like
MVRSKRNQEGRHGIRIAHLYSWQSLLQLAEHPRHDLTELLVGYGLILLVIWSPQPLQVFFVAAPVFWLAVVFVRSRKEWKRWGLGLSNLGRSLWIILASAALAGIALLAAARAGTLHSLSGPFPARWHVLAYAGWAVEQQFILQDYFLLRLTRLLPERSAAVLAAALLFALAHLPNPVLTIATIAWGIISCALFLRYRSVYSVGLAHGILGLTIAVTFPTALTHKMMVGLAYLNYHG